MTMFHNYELLYIQTSLFLPLEKICSLMYTILNVKNWLNYANMIILIIIFFLYNNALYMCMFELL